MSATTAELPLSPLPARVHSRKGRVSVAGQAYVLTATSLFRRPLFRDPEAARAVARLHGHPPIWGPSRCLAWVLMPDHWQGLVVLGPGDTLEHLMRRFKSITARAVEPRFRVNGWLWGRGFQHEAVPDETSLRDAARHLIGQPLREGLVSSVGQYPYWNAVWLDAADGP